MFELKIFAIPGKPNAIFRIHQDENVSPTKKRKSNETDTDELDNKISNQNQGYYKLYDALKAAKLKKIGLEILKYNDQAIVSGESEVPCCIY